MKTYKTNDPFPVLCSTCRAVTTINRSDPTPQSCSRCGGSDHIPYGENTRNAAEFSKFQDDYSRLRSDETGELLKKLKSDPDSVLELFGMEIGDVDAAEHMILEMQNDGPPTGWDAGLHLCPVCERHALTINEVRRSFD